MTLIPAIALRLRIIERDSDLDLLCVLADCTFDAVADSKPTSDLLETSFIPLVACRRTAIYDAERFDAGKCIDEFIGKSVGKPFIVFSS